MRKFKKVARFFTELILTIFLVAFILINSVSSTIFSKSYVLAAIEKSDYYSKVYDSLYSNFENYIQQSGLEESVLKDIVSKEKLEKDTKQIINNIYDGFNEEISTEEIKQNLQKNINKSLNNRTLSSAEQKAIEEFINEICIEYKSTISSFEYDKHINSAYKKIVKYINLAKKITVVAVGVLVIILICLNLKRIYKFAVNVGTSLLATGVILAIINAYINLKVKVQYITVLNDQISAIIRNVSSNIMSVILKYGITCIISGLLLIIIANFWHNIIKYKLILKDIPEEN